MWIALDYDNTFTRAPDEFQKFIDIFGEHHYIWIVTSRGQDTPIEVVPKGISGIAYCNYRAKKDVVREMEIPIDIWIDDDPYYIINGFVTESIPTKLLLKVEDDARLTNE